MADTYTIQLLIVKLPGNLAVTVVIAIVLPATVTDIEKLSCCCDSRSYCLLWNRRGQHENLLIYSNCPFSHECMDGWTVSTWSLLLIPSAF